MIRREAERLAVDAYSVRDLRRQAKSGECPLEFLRFFCVSPPRLVGHTCSTPEIEFRARLFPLLSARNA